MNPFFCIPYSTPTQYTTWFKIGGCNTTKLRLRVWLSLLLSLLFGAMVNVERILYFSGSYKILDIFLSTLSVTFVNIIWYHLFFLYFSFTLSDIHMTYTTLHFFRDPFLAISATFQWFQNFSFGQNPESSTICNG